MIIVVESHNISEYQHLVEQMYRLRARVFRDRLKWDVQVPNGLEYDRYDDEGPVYILYTDQKMTQIKGSLRLLPTTGPTLLHDTFFDTLPDASGFSAPTIWECTRFCVDEELFTRDHHEEMVFVSRVLFAALGEVAIASGIKTVLGNFDASMLRLYRRVGCEVEVLGRTNRHGQTVYLGAFPVSATILARIKARMKDLVGELARPTEGRPLAA